MQRRIALPQLPLPPQGSSQLPETRARAARDLISGGSFCTGETRVLRSPAGKRKKFQNPVRGDPFRGRDYNNVIVFSHAKVGTQNSHNGFYCSFLLCEHNSFIYNSLGVIHTMEQYIARKLLFTGASFVRVYIHYSLLFRFNVV